MPGVVRREQHPTHVIVVLALLLIAATVLKILDGEVTNWPLGSALVAIELVAVFLLLLYRHHRISWWLALLLFSALSGVAMHKGLLGHSDCRCFGIITSPPLVSLSVDLLALTALLYFPLKTSIITRIAAPCSLTLAILAATVGIYQYQHESTLRTDPTLWIGQRFPLLEQINVRSELVDGDWKLLFVRRGCPVCDEELRSVGASPPNGFYRYAVIALGDKDLTYDDMSPFVLWGRLAQGEDLFLDTPLVIDLSNAIVEQVGTSWQQVGRDVSDLAVY